MKDRSEVGDVLDRWKEQARNDKALRRRGSHASRVLKLIAAVRKYRANQGHAGTDCETCAANTREAEALLSESEP